MHRQNNHEKKYIMVNKSNGARIECTEQYVVNWLARGFEVEEIIIPKAVESSQG